LTAGIIVASLDLVFVGRFVILPHGEECIGPNEPDSVSHPEFRRLSHNGWDCSSSVVPNCHQQQRFHRPFIFELRILLERQSVAAASGQDAEPADLSSPFTVPTGTSAAFVTTPEDPNIIPLMISYVADLVPKYSGGNYVPHVTVGVASIDFLKALVAAPFDSFTFSPAGASVYHIGHYGTAATKLHSFKLKN